MKRKINPEQKEIIKRMSGSMASLWTSEKTPTAIIREERKRINRMKIPA